MADTTGSTTGSTRKSTKSGADKASPFGIPGAEFASFEMPKLDYAGAPFDVPPLVRDLAEKGLAQAKAGYDKLKAAAEDATEVAEETFETAKAGLGALNQKALDTAKTNADAGFAFARALFGAKSFTEAYELQAGFARAQAAAFIEQSRELQDTARRVVEDTAEPGRAAFGKALRELKLA